MYPMDRRDNEPSENGFIKDLKAEEKEYNDKVEYNGKVYRVPYQMIKEVVFLDISAGDLKSIENSARLQYRLLLMDSVLKAKVEFVKNRITITYNPHEAQNRKEKTSTKELIDFLAKEGIRTSKEHAKERDVDYFEEIYKPQFEPATIREHAPYGYSREEWKKLKPEWQERQKATSESKYEKFRAFQERYLDSHPELAKEYGHVKKPKKPSLIDRLKGKGKGDNDKGFWFHGA